ncbi:DNA-binding domain-containing protein [Pseudoxanthomonas dokdonensis]|uniref:Uncharacterized protein n=1 Tax=Pseudoxanthomonas dokdonensis TaxID=344882 RepID=A0A0R0CHH7_9GAMM|nr:putative DNA-binding domain-containing protein [Pseudoxanthomonas dokdonensis]KRG69013.1 hypothetical protein ABB29_11270 [Pseudoxanthomonas dokdonensis]
MPHAPEQLRQQQLQLASHLRDPARHAAPAGLEDRRLAIYRSLFFNNIEALLAGNFPVIRKTLGEAGWQQLVRAFYADYRCHTPLFTEIGREFIQFLQQRGEQQPAPDPEWLAELAHYEWVELALQISDEPTPAHDPDGDLLAGTPLLSPTAWALAYRWPVQQIGPDFQPTQAPAAPTLLLVRRDADYRIHFAAISALVYRLLELLGEDQRSGRELLEQLATEAASEDLASFVRDGGAMLEQLRQQGTLLGTDDRSSA